MCRIRARDRWLGASGRLSTAVWAAVTGGRGPHPGELVTDPRDESSGESSNRKWLRVSPGKPSLSSVNWELPESETLGLLRLRKSTGDEHAGFERAGI